MCTHESLLALPDDVLVTIVDLACAAGGEPTVAAMRATCKLLCRLSTHATPTAKLSHLTPDAAAPASKLLSKCTNLRSIRANMCNVTTVSQVVMRAHALQSRALHLRLVDTFGDVPPLLMHALTSIHIVRNHTVRDLPPIPRALRALRLQECSNLRNNLADAIASNASLERLEIVFCPRFSGDVLCGGLARLQRAHTIVIQHVGDTTMGSTSGEALCIGKELVKLCIDTSAPWDCVGVLRHSARLRHLRARFGHGLHNAHAADPELGPHAVDLAALVQNHPLLTHLVLQGANATNAVHLRTLPDLRCLNLTCEVPPAVAHDFAARPTPGAPRSLNLDFGFQWLDTPSLCTPWIVNLRINRAHLEPILPGGSGMPALKHLVLNSSDGIEALFGDGVCPALTTLEIVACTMERLVVPATVTNLTLNHNMLIREIEFLPDSRARRVAVSCCSQLSNVRSLAHCAHLESLEVSTCFALTDLGEAADLPRLRHLVLSHLPALRVPAVLGAPSLTEVRINNVSMASTAPFAPCRRLRVFHLTTSNRLLDVSSLSQCKDLVQLKLRALYIANLHALARCRALCVTTLMTAQDLNVTVAFLKKQLPKAFWHVVSLQNGHGALAHGHSFAGVFS